MMTLCCGVWKKFVPLFILFLFPLVSVSLWEPDHCQAEPANEILRAKQVSSYQKMESALKEVNRLKAKGLDAYFKEVEVPEKGTWYRVYAAAPQPKPRSGTSLKDKKQPPASIKQAASAPSPKVKETVPPPQQPSLGTPVPSPPSPRGKETVHPSPKPNPEKPTSQVVPDVSGKRQPNLSKSVLPEENRKPELSAASAISDGLAQIPASVPVSAEYAAAKAEFDARHYERAAGMLSSLLARKLGDAAQFENSLRLHADCYYFLGEGGNRSFDSQAAESYNNILRHYPDVRSGNDMAYFRLGILLERMGSYEEAYETYSKVIAKYPDSPYKQETLYRMGRILYLTKRLAHAIDKLRSYLTAYPDGSHAFQASFLLGYCLRQTNQQPDGDTWYRSGLTKWNNFEDLPGDVLYDLGRFLLSQKDCAKAAGVFSLYLNLHQEGAWRKNALFDLGRAYYFCNSFSSALKVFGLLLESYPDTLEANESILFIANIGVMEPKTDFNACLPGRDYFKNPIETYDWMRAKYPGGPLEEWLLYQKGYALWKAGRISEALDLYCTLLDTFPNGRLQKESRGYLVLTARRMIDEYYGKGDYLAVADLYYKIRNKIPLSPETTAIFYKIGDSLWKIGLRPDAVALLDRLKQNGSNAAQQAISDFVMMEINYTQGQISEEKWKALLSEFAKDNSPTSSAARKNLGDYFYRTGQYDKVIPLYEALLKDEDHPDLLRISRNYAHALRNNNACSAAINRYLGIIGKCKENPQKCDQGFVGDAYAGLGDCYYETADYERDLAMYQQALPGIKDKENLLWTLFRMGQSYGKMNDTVMAGKTFSELKEKGGDAFWTKVADYWVADEAWSKNNSEYLKKK